MLGSFLRKGSFTYKKKRSHRESVGLYTEKLMGVPKKDERPSAEGLHGLRGGVRYQLIFARRDLL